MNRRSLKYSSAPLAAALLAAGVLLWQGCAALPKPVEPAAARDAGESDLSSPEPAPGGERISRAYPGFVAVIPREDDTLASLASAYLNDPSRDWLIAEYNGISRLRPGEGVAIPLQPFKRGGLGDGGHQTVPVLAYHRFSKDRADILTVTGEAFEAQMAYLKEQGYHVITLDRFFDFLDFRADIPEKSVVLTFDDGWQSMYEIAFPVLRRYGYPATLFLHTSIITGSSVTLSWDQVREMEAEGVVVQSHSLSHRNPDSLLAGETLAAYLDDLEREMRASALTIESKIGKPVRYFAHPYGETNHLVGALLEKLGYRGAFTVKRGSNPFYVDRYRVGRSVIYGNYDLQDFIRNLSVFSEGAGP